MHAVAAVDTLTTLVQDIGQVEEDRSAAVSNFATQGCREGSGPTANIQHGDSRPHLIWSQNRCYDAAHALSRHLRKSPNYSLQTTSTAAQYGPFPIAPLRDNDDRVMGAKDNALRGWSRVQGA